MLKWVLILFPTFCGDLMLQTGHDVQHKMFVGYNNNSKFTIIKNEIIF